jgi:hypothetical protein
MIRSIGRTPAERTTTYRISKVFDQADAEERLPLERMQRTPALAGHAPTRIGY